MTFVSLAPCQYYVDPTRRSGIRHVRCRLVFTQSRQASDPGAMDEVVISLGSLTCCFNATLFLSTKIHYTHALLIAFSYIFYFDSLHTHSLFGLTPYTVVATGRRTNRAIWGTQYYTFDRSVRNGMADYYTASTWPVG